MKKIKDTTRVALLLAALFTVTVGFAQQSFKLRLASYNAENFFDHLHDADPDLPHGKEDIAFLPLAHPLKEICPEISSGFYLRQCQETDWTEQRYLWKLGNVSKALSYISKKPDLVGLSEVENKRVVKALAEKLGYGTGYVASDSPDHRGIDVAIMFNKSRLKLISSKEIAVEGEDLTKPTRNILRLEFQVKDDNGNTVANERLYAYANHWPSQAAPARTRMMTAKILQKDIETVRDEANGNVYIVALGDFNTVPTDTPHPFNDFLTNKNVWSGALVDSEEYARTKHPALNETLLPGSYWFSRDSTWNKLDRIFVSQNLVDESGADLIPSSFFIMKDSRLMTQVIPTNGPQAGQQVMIPRRFDSTATSQQAMGFSDHLPIGVDLKIPVLR